MDGKLLRQALISLAWHWRYEWPSAAREAAWTLISLNKADPAG